MNREWLEQFLAEQAAEAGASEDMDWLGTVERVERPLPNVGPWGQGRYRAEATHSPQNDVRSLMDVGVDAWRGLGDAVERARSERPVRPGLFEDERVLDFLNRYEAGEFDSWLRPLDAPLRAGAGLVRGENPLAHAAYGSETAGQALVDKYGLPEWAGGLVDVAFPSPVGASRAVDMVPLLGFVVPRVLSRFGVGGGTTGVLKQLGYLDDAGLPTGVVGDADLPGVLSMNPDIKYRESRRSGEITLSVRDTQVMVRPSDFNVNDYGLPSVYYVDELYDVKNNDPAGLLTLGDALTRSADATGVTLQADPQAFGHMAMSTPQLETLYGKLGFVFDSGTTKSMTREPLPLDEPGRQAEMLRRSLLMEQIFETPDVWVDNPSEVIRLASQRVPSKRLLDRLGIDSSVTNSEEIASIVNELPANINLGPSQAAPGSWATPPAVVPEVQEGVSKVVNSFMGVAGAPGVDPAVLNKERQALIDWLAPRLGTSRISGMSERDAFFVFNNMAPNLVSEYEDGSNLFFALQNEFGEDLTRFKAP